MKLTKRELKEIIVQEIHRFNKQLKEGKLSEMQTKHKNFFLDQIQKDTISLKNQIAYTKDALKHDLEKWERKEYSEVLKKLQKDLKEMIAREKRVKKWEVSEGKLKEAIRHTEARFLYVPKKDIKKAIKVVKSMPTSLKGKIEMQKKPSDKVKGFYAITTTKYLFNAVVEYLATADIGVKTISKGKM